MNVLCTYVARFVHMHEFVRHYRRYETLKLFSADVTKWSHRSNGRRPSSIPVDFPILLYLANLAMLAICSKKWHRGQSLLKLERLNMKLGRPTE